VRLSDLDQILYSLIALAVSQPGRSPWQARHTTRAALLTLMAIYELMQAMAGSLEACSSMTPHIALFSN
jgi:hypothetical protein